MNNKTIVFLGVIVIVIIILVAWVNNKDKVPTNETENITNLTSDNQGEVKEFSMTSFVDMTGDSPKPQFSLKEINVKKGDTVRIKVMVTSGMHDFKIDEYSIYEDTQLNKESVIEFVADKPGEFVYYCTKPGHRENGHWGILKVSEGTSEK